MGARWVVALGGVLVPLLVAGCLDPTQITLAVTTDVDCRVGDPSLQETAFHFGPGSLEVGAHPATETSDCLTRSDQDNLVGELVVVPSDERDAPLAIEVVGAVNVSASECRPPDYGDRCIVARRALRFLEHESLSMPIALRAACIGVLCGPTKTCVNGSCVGADVDPNKCLGAGCGETVLPEIDWSETSDGEPGTIVPVVTDPGASLEPVQLGAGDRHVMVWTDDREGSFGVYSKHLDPQGTPLDNDQAVLGGTNTHWHPAIADRPAGGYWLAVNQQSLLERAVVVVAIGDQSSTAPDPVVLVGERDPAVAATSDRVVMATVYGGGIRGRIAGSSPSFDLAPVNLSPDSVDAAEPSVAASAGGAAVAWQDVRDGNPEIYVSVLSQSGGLTATSVRISQAAGTSTEPSIAATGDGYGVAWSDDRHGDREIYFALLDRNGVVTEELRVTDAPGVSDQPSLVWIGSSYALAWRDGRDGNDEIYFVRISAIGEPKSPLRITETGGRSLEPSLAWAGGTFGLVWEDDQNESWDLYFVPITP